MCVYIYVCVYIIPWGNGTNSSEDLEGTMNERRVTALQARVIDVNSVLQEKEALSTAASAGSHAVIEASVINLSAQAHREHIQKV